MDELPIVPSSNSKIKMYNLEDYVVECYLQGINPNRIATLCNKKLELQKKDKKIESYADINAQNVKVYIEGKLLEKEFKTVDLATVSVINRKAIDVIEELESQKNLIVQEIDKLRDPEASVSDSKQVFFIDLLKQMGKLLELSANIQGKIQPSISVAILKGNLTKLIEKIIAHPDIPDNIKTIICDMIANEILSEALLKSVSGSEIKNG